MKENKDTNKNSKLNTIKNISILTAVFGALSFYSFNCAPPSFQVADENSLVLSSTTGEIVSGNQSPLLDEKVQAPQALLTFSQIYESMLNLTGQRGTVSNAQLTEFGIRAGAFGVSSELEKVNSPMLLALTSFAGSVCDGLVTREQGLGAAQRLYFGQVNFGGAIGTLTNDAYLDGIAKMMTAFYGRAPSAEESALFTAYRTDFVASIPAANINQAAQTRALVVSSCAAVLSGFDAFTY